VGAVNLGPGRQSASQDSPYGISRIGGQAGTQAPDATPLFSQDQGSRARSTIHSLPADYEAWSDSTAPTREIAGKAQRELERRGYQVAEWTREDQSFDREADEPEGQADAPEIEADAPVVPEPEANAPEVADSAGPEPEPEPGVV
jgi:hypothetical protein